MKESERQPDTKSYTRRILSNDRQKDIELTLKLLLMKKKHQQHSLDHAAHLQRREENNNSEKNHMILNVIPNLFLMGLQTCINNNK